MTTVDAQTGEVVTITPVTGTFLDKLTDAQRSRLAAVIPADQDREATLRKALELLALGLRQDAKLAECEPFSVIVATASGLAAGLEPQFGQLSSRTADFLVIPRAGKAVVQMTVTGWVTLLSRAGWSVEAHAIYEADAFDVDLGAGLLSHRPEMRGDRGEVVGAWARFRRGGAAHVELLTCEQLEQVRDSSDGWKRQGNASPWGKWPDRMAVKSCIARGARHLDLGAMADAVGLAAEGGL